MEEVIGIVKEYPVRLLYMDSGSIILFPMSLRKINYDTSICLADDSLLV